MSVQDGQRQLLRDVLKDEAVWDEFFHNPQDFADQHGVNLDAATIAAISGRSSDAVDDLNGPRTIAQWPAAIAAVSAAVVAATQVVQAVSNALSSIRAMPVDTSANHKLTL